jgi:hypothetical protein
MSTPQNTPREGSHEVPAPLAAVILLAGAAMIWAYHKRPVPSPEGDAKGQPAKSSRAERQVEPKGPPIRPARPSRSADRFRRQNTVHLFDPPNVRSDTVWEDAIRLFPEAFGIDSPDHGLDEMLFHLSTSPELGEHDS